MIRGTPRRPSRPALKFDDCRMCRFRRKPEICADCDFGEQFEDASIAPLHFDDAALFDRKDKSLVTEDDEPFYNPDDLVDRLDERNKDENDE